MVGVIVPSEFESKVIKIPHEVSGMGKIAATAMAYSLVCRGVDKILLTGFCGSIRGYKIGEVVKPQMFIEGDYNTHPLEKYPNVIGVKHGVMISQDRFLVSNPYYFKYPKIACDMESYAVAYVCKRFGMKFECIKIVSDIVGSNSTDDFLDNCKKYAPKLHKVLKGYK